MMKHLFPLLLLAGALLQAQEFEVRIELENAHLGELFFGCSREASQGYDRGKDIFCPPGGMGDTGLAWFAAPAPELPFLYKDIKDCALPRQWTLLVQPPLRKKLILKWEKDKLPRELDFQLTGAGLNLNMKTTGELTVPAKGTLLISVRRAETESTEQKK